MNLHQNLLRKYNCVEKNRMEQYGVDFELMEWEDTKVIIFVIDLLFKGFI